MNKCPGYISQQKTNVLTHCPGCSMSGTDLNSVIQSQAIYHSALQGNRKNKAYKSLQKKNACNHTIAHVQ